MRTLGRSGVILYLGPVDEANTVLTLNQIPGVLMKTAVVYKEVFSEEGSSAEDTFEDPHHGLTNLEVGTLGGTHLRMDHFHKLRND